MATARQVSIDTVLECPYPSIRETDRLRVERDRATTVGERFAAPQIERGAQCRRRCLWIIASHLAARRVDQIPEWPLIDVIGGDVEHIAAVPVADSGRACLSQRFPDRRNADLEHVPR